MVKHTKNIPFQYVTEVCLGTFWYVFWVSLEYVNYVPKMMLCDVFWVFQRYLRQTSDKALTYLNIIYTVPNVGMFIVCSRYVLGIFKA